MIRLLKYLMQVIYTKNEQRGVAYFRAIVLTSVSIFITFLLLFIILGCIYPSMYIWYLHRDYKSADQFFAISYFSISFLLLRLFIRKEDVANTTLTNEQIKRAYIYFAVSLILATILIVVLGMEFLAPIAHSQINSN